MRFSVCIGYWIWLLPVGLDIVRFTCLSLLLLSWGLPGDSFEEGWLRPGLPPLRMLSGPYQHFKNAIVSAWRGRAADVLTSRKGFRGGPFLDYVGTRQLLFSSHLRERDIMLLRSILSGGAWNGFPLGKTTEKMFLAVSVVGSMGMVIFFGIALSLPLCVFGSIQNFTPS